MKAFLTFFISISLINLCHSQNTIWGTTLKGGQYNCGYIYRTDSIGDHLTIVHHFNHTKDGNAPGPIMQASNGKLYGMTFRGGQGVIVYTGPNGSDSTQGGTLFEYDPILDSLKTLIHFNSMDAQYPTGFDGPSSMRILEVSAGKLWCVFNVSKNSVSVTQSLPRYVLSYAIATNSMTPVMMIPSWTTPAYPGYTVYTSFSGELIKAANGMVYGTTAGYSSCATTTDGSNGSVIKINPATNAFTFTRPFPCSYANGWLPESKLAEANGKLYGTTRWGGPAISFPTNFGDGIIYEYDPVGNTYTEKYDLPGGSLGGYPTGQLVKADNGKLYGTTFYGTPYTNYPKGSGVLYEYDVTANVYAKKKDFTNTYYVMDIGINAALWLKAHSGKLYGTTDNGIFEYNSLTDQIRPASRVDFNHVLNSIIEICRKPSYKASATYSYTICENSFFTFDTHCSNAKTIIWKHNGIVAPSYTAGVLNFNHIALSDAGTWVCELTNDCGTTITPTLTLVVNPTGTGVVTSSLTPAGNTHICPGSTITLSGNTGGVWNTGVTNSSINISQPGAYQVANTNACGKTYSNIITIDTISTPLVPLITFTTSGTYNGAILSRYMCSGDSAQLVGNVPGGIWNTGETTSSIYVKDNLPHYVTITNQCTSVASATAQVTYYPPVATPIIGQTGPIQICHGDSVLLTATGASAITWYRMVGNNYSYVDYASNVYVKVTGDYYARINTACGVIYSQPIHVNADTLALDTAIISASGALTFCPGASVILTSNYSNCVWSTGVTSQSISVTQTGNYYATNSNSCSSVVSAVINVSVIATPSVSYTEPQVPVCLTTPVFTLASASPSGGNYSGAGVSGNTFDPLLAGSGTHTVSYTLYDNSTGCSSIATQTIYVDYDPSIILAGPSNTICAGSSVILVQPSSNGVWNTGQTGPYISLTTAGIYYVTQTNSCGTSVNSNTVQISIKPIPSQPIITQIGNDLIASPAQTYQWYLNGGIITGATSQTYTPTQNGDYTVLISGVNGCYNTSGIYSYLITGIHPIDSEDTTIRIFPNPSYGNFVIALPQGDIKVQIMNSIGQLVYQKTSKNERELNLQLTQDGIYFIEITTEKGIYVEKLVINAK